jgi:hypothetical protein
MQHRIGRSRGFGHDLAAHWHAVVGAGIPSDNPVEITSTQT